ncbi:hypothetical protein HYG81_21415 (plasmid) [Natrinema zhouii]|uniref:hypothetical protein n=1 Tax=Natrinema zhouii TaxID=1710539 RepID=UPI001D00159E|nr:hypothetical protein [Natrinema zhouii]UHQ98139.1 hypothetical protein HYG81_21415 [Natrinema zhouii]
MRNNETNVNKFNGKASGSVEDEDISYRPLGEVYKEELLKFCEKEGTPFQPFRTYDLAGHAVRPEVQRFICEDCGHRAYPYEGLHSSKDQIRDEFAAIGCNE